MTNTSFMKKHCKYIMDIFTIQCRAVQVQLLQFKEVVHQNELSSQKFKTAKFGYRIFFIIRIMIKFLQA